MEDFMKKLRRIISIFTLIVILISFLFILTGCKISAETYENGVSVEVDDETKGTFDSILAWIEERLSRVFNTSNE